MATVGRLVDDLAQHLRQRIVSGELSEGEKLTEHGVASEYSVARPTVRSALELLGQDGLIVREPHLPPRVVLVPPEDVPEILALLEAIEALALDRIVDNQTAVKSLTAVSGASGLSLHHALEQMVLTANSARLATIHRRLTFELILGSRSLLSSLVDSSSPLAEADQIDQLMSALLRADAWNARTHLLGLQSLRRTRIHMPQAARRM